MPAAALPSAACAAPDPTHRREPSAPPTHAHSSVQSVKSTEAAPRQGVMGLSAPWSDTGSGDCRHYVFGVRVPGGAGGGVGVGGVGAGAGAVDAGGDVDVRMVGMVGEDSAGSSTARSSLYV